MSNTRKNLSNKHTAMLAGLREMGLNSLLINPTYGTRLKLVSVVTNAPVQADSPFSESLCPRSECMKCVTACPVKAISSSGAIDKDKCAKYYRRYPDIYFETWGLYLCRECRRVCPGAAGARKNVSDAVERFYYRQIDPCKELLWLMLTGLKE